MVFVRGIRNYTQLHAVFGPPNYTQITRTMLAVFAPEMPPRHPKSHTRSRSRSLPGCFALVGYGPDQGREPENLELRSGRVWRVGGFIRAWGSGIGGEECRGGLAPGLARPSRYAHQAMALPTQLASNGSSVNVKATARSSVADQAMALQTQLAQATAPTDSTSKKQLARPSSCYARDREYGCLNLRSNPCHRLQCFRRLGLARALK